MATSSKKNKNREQQQLPTTEPVAFPHEWTDSSDEDEEFVDAPDTDFIDNQSSSTKKDSQPELLHERLNEQLPQKSPEEPYFMNEELLAQREALLTEAEKEQHYKESQTSKEAGNDLYGRHEYEQALDKYSDALSLCPLKYTRDRSIIYANRAACLMKLEKYEAAVQSCTISIKLDPTYIKALVRRADSYKCIEKLEEALQDYQRILELDPNHAQARKEVYTLPDQIKERNEKLKDEMLGKLKELGNMILKPFGLSTNNFQLQQDPSSGSYSVNFQK